MHDFEDATRVTADGERLKATLSPSWQAFGPNGGYMATIALRAAGLRSSFRRPASLGCTFLSRPALEEANVEVVSLRKAKRAECLRVSMFQETRAILEAHVWLTEEVPGVVHDVATMPDAPSPESLTPLDQLPVELRHEALPVWANIEERLVNWKGIPREVEDPASTGWFRFRPRDHYDDPLVDAGRALVVLDILVGAAAHIAHVDTVIVAPTLRLSAQFHRSPPPGWFFCNARAPIAEAGLVYGHGRAWADRKAVLSFHSQSMCVGEPQRMRRHA